MAIVKFLGLDGNWNNTANWSTGAVPVDDTDYAFFPPGRQSITSGFDQSLVNLLGIETHEGYAGNIGNASTPLRIVCDKVHHRGTGSFYYKDEHATDKTDTIIVDSANLRDAFILTGDEVETLVVYSGGVVQGASILTNGFVSPDTKRARVGIVSNGTATVWNFNGGRVEVSIPPATGKGEFTIGRGTVTGNVQGVDGLRMSGGRCEFVGDVPQANDTVNGHIILTGRAVLDITRYNSSYFGNALAAGGIYDIIALSGTQIIRREDQTLTADRLLHIASGVERVESGL